MASTYVLCPSKIQPGISDGVSTTELRTTDYGLRTTEYGGNTGDVARTLPRSELSTYGKVDRRVESKELRPGTKPEDKSDGGCGVRHAEGVEQNQSRVSY